MDSQVILDMGSNREMHAHDLHLMARIAKLMQTTDSLK